MREALLGLGVITTSLSRPPRIVAFNGVGKHTSTYAIHTGSDESCVSPSPRIEVARRRDHATQESTFCRTFKLFGAGMGTYSGIIYCTLKRRVGAAGR